MYYKAELEYLTRVLKKMRLQVIQLSQGEIPDQMIDFGLRRFLGRQAEYERTFREATVQAKENTIYKLTDEFMCNYIFLLLPQPAKPVLLLVGPYMSFELTHEQLLEEAERFSVPMWRLSQLEESYGTIPAIADETTLFNMISGFGEVLWGGGNAFEIINLNKEMSGSPEPISVPNADLSREDMMLRMQMMETRYAYENELMNTVAKGLSQRAEMMLLGFSKAAFEQRMADPIRNMKNYAIICNTLLRKAAEQGGVHPIYLDSTSSEFARRIESMTTLDAGIAMMGEMARSYCRLVKKHATKHYSSPVQKAITYIDSDLSGELSLAALAATQGINASYLSTLFKKETGRTVTDFVNQRRVDHAAHLLTTTKLQIQTIAQHCGVSDVNYFSKMFKKYIGMTPKEYRNEMHTKFGGAKG